MELSSKGIELMEIPRYVVFGPGAISRIGSVLNKLGLGGMRTVVVSGSGPTSKIAEEHVLPFLESEELVHHRVGKGGLEDVRKVMRTIGRSRAVVIAVGGGKVIDVAKAAAYYSGVKYLAVPTSAANDGISSPVVSFRLRREIEAAEGRAPSIMAAPYAIIADTEIIVNAPYETLVSGCGDLVAKFTANLDWRLAHRLRGEDYSEYASSMAILSARLIVKHADLIPKKVEEGARLVVKALIGSGVAMSIAGSSRPASGSEHLFSHALDYLSEKHGFKPAAHGAQVGVGSIMMMWMHGGNWRMLKRTLEKVRAPTNAEELGIEKEYIIEALTMMHKIRPERYTILGEKGLSREAAVRVARETGVI